MKTLLLMRHAKSDWGSAPAADHDRPLSDRGHRSAVAMGELLAAWGEIPDLVVTSSATRARSTAEEAAAAGSWDCPILVEPELYGSGPDAVLRAGERLGGKAAVLMLVGHEPTWSGLVRHLTGGSVDMRTGCVAAVDLMSDSWQGLAEARGVLRFLVGPRLIAPGGGS